MEEGGVSVGGGVLADLSRIDSNPDIKHSEAVTSSHTKMN